MLIRMQHHQHSHRAGRHQRRHAVARGPARIGQEPGGIGLALDRDGQEQRQDRQSRTHRPARQQGMAAHSRHRPACQHKGRPQPRQIAQRQHDIGAQPQKAAMAGGLGENHIRPVRADVTIKLHAAALLRPCAGSCFDATGPVSAAARAITSRTMSV
jgi:hypothetical protein